MLKINTNVITTNMRLDNQLYTLHNITSPQYKRQTICNTRHMHAILDTCMQYTCIKNISLTLKIPFSHRYVNAHSHLGTLTHEQRGEGH